MAENILQVKNLKTYFHTEAGLVKAVNDVSFNVEKGKTLGIVGESGCGKSITSLSIMGLVERPGKIEGGEILFEGEDLLKMTEAQMRNIRGKKIAMIFQEPMTSLNPVYTIGQQLIEALLLHEKMTKQEAKARAIEMLKLVKIPLAERRFDEYPHQLSGGMRQRVMIAMALCCNPAMLICDEPTTALDVTIQAQILDLINELKEKTGTSVMMITLLVLRSKMRRPMQEQRISLLVLRSKMSAMLLLHSMCLLQEQRIFLLVLLFRFFLL